MTAVKQAWTEKFDIGPGNMKTIASPARYSSAAHPNTP